MRSSRRTLGGVNALLTHGNNLMGTSNYSQSALGMNKTVKHYYHHPHQLHSVTRLQQQKRDIDDLLWRVTSGGAGMTHFENDDLKHLQKIDPAEQLDGLISPSPEPVGSGLKSSPNEKNYMAIEGDMIAQKATGFASK